MLKFIKQKYSIPTNIKLNHTNNKKKKINLEVTFDNLNPQDTYNIIIIDI